MRYLDMGRYRLNDGEEDIEIRAAKFTVNNEAVIFLGDDGRVVLRLPTDDVHAIELIGD